MEYLNKHPISTKMENSLKFDLPTSNTSIIKVIGVGGGGSNAVNYMYEQGIKGVDFIVCNTDAQAIDNSPVPFKVQLGSTLTEGRGAGSIPEVGRNAAIESIEEIRTLLSTNTNLVFITAGMGGGTGTGAAPVIAKIAKDMGILTVGIVTVPFMFEGRKRSVQADLGLKEMRESVDTLLIIRNDKLRELYGNLTLKQAFSHADEVLCTAAKGIAEVITLTGTVNVDMNDVKTVMKDSGVAIMGSGRASGEGRAKRSIQMALESPLLNDNDINGANFVLLNITFGQDELLMDEVSEITDYIQDQAGMGAEVIWGYGQDSTLGDDISVTIIATGFAAKTVDHVLPVAEAQPKKLWLETEGAKEVVNKVEKPTQDVTPTAPVVNQLVEEPFLKPVEKPLEFEFDVTNNITAAAEEVEEELPPLSSVKLTLDGTSQAEEQKVYMNLSDDMDAFVGQSQESTVPTATLAHKEEQTISDRPARTELIARNKEREMRIREFTIKLKTPSGLNELESEPAYARRKVSLDTPSHSSESNVSRFSLSDSVDENGIKKFGLRENPFLDDQVD
jgi:cell division protein FtsZ